MEKDHLNNSPLYSTEEVKEIKFLYQQILNILIRELPNFGEKYKINGWFHIVDIKRWVIVWSKRISWDYLSATHSTIEWEYLQDENENSIRFVEIVLNSWETLNFSTISSPDEWTINLDDYFNHLSDKSKIKFDEYRMRLTEIESNHFHSKSYMENFNKIIKSSKEDLAKSLNIQQSF